MPLPAVTNPRITYVQGEDSLLVEWDAPDPNVVSYVEVMRRNNAGGFPYPNPAGSYVSSIAATPPVTVAFANPEYPDPPAPDVNGRWLMFLDEELTPGAPWGSGLAWWDPDTGVLEPVDAIDQGQWDPNTGTIDFGSGFTWEDQDEGWVEVEAVDASAGEVSDSPPDGVQVEYRVRNYNDEANTGPWAYVGVATVTADTEVQPGVAEGYYVKRSIVIQTAGTENFNIIFQLDGTSLLADENVVQEAFDLGDEFVDGLAYELRLTKDTEASSHYVDEDFDRFLALRMWASRWARANGWLLRGAINDDTTGVAGQMTGMKDEAELHIRAILTAKFEQEEDEAGTGAGDFQSVQMTFGPTECLADEFSSNG